MQSGLTKECLEVTNMVDKGITNAIARVISLNDILKEYGIAEQKYPEFNSPHEGYAVLLEEVDELWDEVKRYKDKGPEDEHFESMKIEAAQVGAMALKFLNKLHSMEMEEKLR